MDTTNANANATNYNIFNEDTGLYNENNISQHRLCTSKYMSVTSNSYILCIPQIPYTATKMDVARAVENQILTSGTGLSASISDFTHVTNVTFIRAFDQVTFEEVRRRFARDFETTTGYSDPWYKIAFVGVDIPPTYTENGVQVYTNGEDAFYRGVCRGDIVINSWTDAFFVAHPRTYFQPQQQTQQQTQQQLQTTGEDRGGAGAAFQKWKYDFKMRQLERKVKDCENTIRQYELDAIRNQNTVNDYAESIRFLTRRRLDSPDLHGLNCASIQITTFISVLNNRYSQICVSDTTFLEINRNMKFKEMNGYAIRACDDCDACQELIHSIDHVCAEDRDEIFARIEQTICAANKSVQQFEKLHINAERSLFGLRNRRVLEDFGMYLNTALEIVEEVTRRVATFTQDLEYARCYGEGQPLLHHLSNAASTAETVCYNYDYDYAENAENVDDYQEDYENDYEEGCGDNTGIESTRQMLHYFDERNQDLYNKGAEDREEEVVMIEGEEENVAKTDIKASPDATANTNTNTNTMNSEIVDKQEKKKSGGWLPSWF